MFALEGYLLSVLFFTLFLSHTFFFILSRETFFVNDEFTIAKMEESGREEVEVEERVWALHIGIFSLIFFTLPFTLLSFSHTFCFSMDTFVICKC